MRLIFSALLGLPWALFLVQGTLSQKDSGKQGSLTPNIVFFFMDDMDIELGGDLPLDKTRQWISDVGVSFANSFVNIPICCPSRYSNIR